MEQDVKRQDAASHEMSGWLLLVRNGWLLLLVCSTN